MKTIGFMFAVMLVGCSSQQVEEHTQPDMSQQLCDQDSQCPVGDSCQGGKIGGPGLPLPPGVSGMPRLHLGGHCASVNDLDAPLDMTTLSNDEPTAFNFHIFDSQGNDLGPAEDVANAFGYLDNTGYFWRIINLTTADVLPAYTASSANDTIALAYASNNCKGQAYAGESYLTGMTFLQPDNQVSAVRGDSISVVIGSVYTLDRQAGQCYMLITDPQGELTSIAVSVNGVAGHTVALASDGTTTPWLEALDLYQTDEPITNNLLGAKQQGELYGTGASVAATTLDVITGPPVLNAPLSVE